MELGDVRDDVIGVSHREDADHALRGGDSVNVAEVLLEFVSESGPVVEEGWLVVDLEEVLIPAKCYAFEVRAGVGDFLGIVVELVGVGSKDEPTLCDERAKFRPVGS